MIIDTDGCFLYENEQFFNHFIGDGITMFNPVPEYFRYYVGIEKVIIFEKED